MHRQISDECCGYSCSVTGKVNQCHEVQQNNNDSVLLRDAITARAGRFFPASGSYRGD